MNVIGILITTCLTSLCLIMPGFCDAPVLPNVVQKVKVESQEFLSKEDKGILETPFVEKVDKEPKVIQPNDKVEKKDIYSTKNIFKIGGVILGIVLLLFVIVAIKNFVFGKLKQEGQDLTQAKGEAPVQQLKDGSISKAVLSFIRHRIKR